MGNFFSNQYKVESQFHMDTGADLKYVIGNVINTSDVHSLKSFTFSELKLATRNFRPDSIIGGAFASVFQGWVDANSLTASKPGTGMAVAVKRLRKKEWQGHKEWLEEITYIGKMHHLNLVKLIGYCLEDDHRFLVYEFMSNSSMEHHLFRRGSEPLSWNIRMKVSLGAARGLAFLHTAEIAVIYGDFKNSKILLDLNYNAKLYGFGLSRDDIDHVSTCVHDTVWPTANYGYATPEYRSRDHSTTQSDVYNFGVVLVEILTGKREIDETRPTGQHNLIEWAKPYMNNKKKLIQILDSHLEGKYSMDRALKVANLALKCLSTTPKLRPTMDEVVTVLEQLQDSKKTLQGDPKDGKTYLFLSLPSLCR